MNTGTLAGIRALGRDLRDGLRSRPARTALAVLGIAVGMAATGVLLAALEGLQEQARQLQNAFGADVFAVAAGSGSRGRLQRSDVALLRANLPGCGASGVRVGAAVAELPGAQLLAADEQLARVRRWPMVAGRFLDAFDVRDSARVVVVSEALAGERGLSPGGVLRIHGIPFTVVGIVGSVGVDDGGESGVMVGRRTAFVPWSAATPWEVEAGRDVNVLFVNAAGGWTIDRAVEAAKRILRVERRGAMPGSAWVTQDVLLAGIRRLQRTIGAAAGTIAALCLVMGGATLMSLMVANVRDRIVEIGLRRALGATPGDVAALFVGEALILSGAGSIGASLLANGILLTVADQSPLPLRVGAISVAGPVVAALVLGIVFSYWPARMAARIVPAEALKSE
jgi:putative ABC transport system permease protein